VPRFVRRMYESIGALRILDLNSSRSVLERLSLTNFNLVPKINQNINFETFVFQPTNSFLKKINRDKNENVIK
jgi:hypothetical protein